MERSSAAVVRRENCRGEKKRSEVDEMAVVEDIRMVDRHPEDKRKKKKEGEDYKQEEKEKEILRLGQEKSEEEGDFADSLKSPVYFFLLLLFGQPRLFFLLSLFLLLFYLPRRLMKELWFSLTQGEKKKKEGDDQVE